MKKECNCDVTITVTHQENCALFTDKHWCVLCGDNESIASGVDAFVYGVPTDTFCYMCARVIHDQVIKPIRAFYKLGA